jgi:hypothetical protein
MDDCQSSEVRDGKNLKGRALGFVLGTVGKGVLQKAFRNTVKAIEAPERRRRSDIALKLIAAVDRQETPWISKHFMCALPHGSQRSSVSPNKGSA